MLFDPTNNALYGALRNGKLYKLESGTTDDGQPFSVRYLSKYHDQGLPDNQKRYNDVTIDFDSFGDTYTVKAFFDDGKTGVAIGSLFSVGRDRFTFPINTQFGQDARNMALFINGNSSNGLRIFDAVTHYYVEAREGFTFDSGTVDLGTQLVKEIEEMELEIETGNGTTINWTILSDEPGRVMQIRTQQGRIIGGGRRRIFIPMPVTVEGRIFRFTMTATTRYRLHRVAWKVKPIGEYLDGQFGDDYETSELTLAA